MATSRNSSEANFPDIQNAKDLADFVKKHGLKGLRKEVKKRLNMWKEVSLNIGVIGGSGAGKSAFINTLRRLTPMDPLAARTGVVEETMKPTSYDHPKNPNVKIWDLPGLGTPSFPKETYAEQIQLERYDFFIIICSGRFRDDDLWCANEIRKQGKKFYFVRTKIDVDIQNQLQDYPHEYNSTDVIQKVKADCTNQLLKHKFDNPVVFLVSKNPLKYDFPALEERLIADRHELKRDSFVLTLRSASQEVIAEKSVQLLKRSWLAAAACVLIKSSQVKELSIRVNMEKLSKQLRFYKQVFGLDNEGLEDLSKSANIPIVELKSLIKQEFWFEFTENTFVNEMKKLGDIKTPEEAPYFKLLQIPVIGFIFNCPRSFEATKKFLRITIESMGHAATTLLSTALSKASLNEW